MLQVEHSSGRVVLVGAMTRSEDDRVPSRREVEAAFIALRVKHGSVSSAEIETLYRAYTRAVPPTTEKE